MHWIGIGLGSIAIALALFSLWRIRKIGRIAEGDRVVVVIDDVHLWGTVKVIDGDAVTVRLDQGTPYTGRKDLFTRCWRIVGTS